MTCSASLLAAAAGGDGSTPPVRKMIEAKDGLKIACEVRGGGDTALLFLHGWCGDRQYWKHQVEVFSPDYRVVTVDQAGHGESGRNRDQWTVLRLAEDVESVVKALDLRRVIIVGHSMGAPVGLAAAKRLPGKVVAVIGVDTLQNAEVKMPEETLKPILDGFAADFQGTLRTTFTGLLPQQTNPELVQWLLSRAAAQDQKMALALMRDLTSTDTKALLREAHVPVRCINSAGGYQFFNPTAIEINRKYADYKAVFIENVGHYPMLEKPAEFNRFLREVLREFATRK